MSFIKPSSLSLLMNLSSSLVSLGLEGTGLQGNLPQNLLCLPNLQKLDLSGNDELKVELPKSNWSTPLRYLDLSDISFSGEVPDSIGHLKSLNYLGLSGCKFEGPFPLSLWNLTKLTDLSLSGNNFSGEIPSSISNFQHLTSLDLSNNRFEGPIPRSLWNLTKLSYLILNENNFSGEIPSSISNLQHLIFLVLYNNNLGGQLPSSLVDLTQLSYLNLGQNKFVGPIPENMDRLSNLHTLGLYENSLNGTIPQGCFSLPALSYLSLRDNQLTGPIGEFSVYSVEYLDLSNNKLQGNIPKSMFDLENLTDLTLYSNNLSGIVDFDQFSKLPFLMSLDLSHNNFLSLNYDSSVNYTFPNLENLYLSFCNISSFPKFLVQLPRLSSLDLSNNKIQGKIPKWFNDVARGLSYLDLSRNFLASAEDLSLSLWSIQSVDLSSNRLRGNLPIPSGDTEFFSVSNNTLTGDISFAICNASSLYVLDLSRNNLTGMIPQCFGTFPSLTVLDLHMNKLNGTIPGKFSQENLLQTIKFNDNQLEGPLPRSLAHCKQLEVLDLGKNNIEDVFPSWLEPLQNLQVLVLRANKFHGVITPSRTKHTFPSLRIFDVSNNFFRGPLPRAYVKNFKGMMNVSDGPTGLHYMQNERFSYNDSVVLTVKGNYVEMERILTIFTTIDLSNNQFEGEIPEDIGGLNSLIGLNLSHNRITGNIPQSLGDLTSLEWLDLSSNKLIGEIPPVLTNLNSLAVLNLSQNQLEGIIPTGKQFNTFDNDSYEGNPGLCGWPLSKSCTKGEELPPNSTNFHHMEEKFGFGWKPVAVGYACGVVFGMLLGHIVFSTGKPQWLVRIFAGVPNKKMKRRNNRARTNRC